MSTDARRVILERIRGAVNSTASDALPIPRAYRQTTNATDLVTLLAERVGEYRATVHITDPSGLAGVIAAILERLEVKCVAVPADLPEHWIPAHLERLTDHATLEPGALEHTDAVVTGAAFAIAETGTIILDHAETQGRRVLSLVPDKHICVVSEAAIVDNLPSATVSLARSIALGRPLTFISGPSATSDIELNRVEGVHGPRVLEVVIVSERPTSG
jgi:L-lactate dehydrogenase complex protein LldG